MSPDDDHSDEGGSGEEALTEELKRIDADSEAVEVDFEASGSASASVDVDSAADGTPTRMASRQR
jgi:hypothetical protein